MALRAIAWPAVSTKEQAEDDKASMEAQEKEQLAYAEVNGWRVVDTLRVPGHSRSYIDYYEMANDAADAGITAFLDLIKHCKAKDFDVLMVRDGDRLAREQAPIHFMVSTIIAAGARIFSFQDGWVHEGNYRMVATMWAYRASTEVDQLKVKQRQGKEKNTLEKGIFTNGKAPFGFRQIRNDKGRIVETAIDESLRLIFNDVAAVVLDKVTWKHVERELFNRYGHVDPRTGKPFKRMFFYHWLHNVWVWGHAARRYKSVEHANKQKTNSWVIDPALPIPADIQVSLNIRTPIYTGELGEALKAELRRRHLLQGGSRPNRSHRFTGLILCGFCGYYLVFDKDRRSQPYYRCHSKYTARLRPGCERYRYISEETVREWLDEKLRYMAEHRLPDMLARTEVEPPDHLMAIVRGQLVDIERELMMLIRQQAKADAGIADLYQNEIETATARRLALQTQLARLEDQKKASDTSDAVAGFAEYLDIGPDAFWQSEPTRINQILHRILGNRRLVMLDGEIDHLADAPLPPQHIHGRRSKRKARRNSV